MSNVNFFSKRKYTIISLFKWFFFFSIFTTYIIYFGFRFQINNNTKYFKKTWFIPRYCSYFGFELISYVLTIIYLFNVLFSILLIILFFHIFILKSTYLSLYNYYSVYYDFFSFFIFIYWFFCINNIYLYICRSLNLSFFVFSGYYIYRFECIVMHLTMVYDSLTYFTHR